MPTLHPITPRKVRFEPMDTSSPTRPEYSPLTPKTYHRSAAYHTATPTSPSPTTRKRKHDSASSLPSHLHPVPTQSGPDIAHPPAAKKPRTSGWGTEDSGWPSEESLAGEMLRQFRLRSFNIPKVSERRCRERDEEFDRYAANTVVSTCRTLKSTSIDAERKEMYAVQWMKIVEEIGFWGSVEAAFLSNVKSVSLSEGIEEFRRCKERRWAEGNKTKNAFEEKAARGVVWGKEWCQRHRADDPDPAFHYEVDSMDASPGAHSRAKWDAMRDWVDKQEELYQQRVRARKTRAERDAEGAAAREKRVLEGRANAEDVILYAADTAKVQQPGSYGRMSTRGSKKMEF